MSTLDEIRERDARLHPTTLFQIENSDRRTLLALLDAQALELQAVREALGKYGRHLDGCWFGYAPNAECKCGLDAALKQSRGA